MPPPPLIGCNSEPIASRFPPSSLEWRAHDLIGAVESARASLVKPVPFYIYDSDVLPTSVETELAVMSKCKASLHRYHYGGEYYWLLSLAKHPWRVMTAADAELLIVPSLFSFQVPRGRAGGPKAQFCKGLTSIEKIMRVISQTETWRTRLNDHVYVNLDWEYACLPGVVNQEGNTSCRPGTGGHPPLLRAFVESHWSDPLLHSTYVPSPQPRVDWLIAAPYVDNGEGHLLANTTAGWAAEQERAHSRQARRNVSIFFGGRTSTRIGPGHAQLGYYARWELMRSWMRHKSHTTTDATSGMEQLLIVDSDRNPNKIPGKDLPAAPFCLEDGTTPPSWPAHTPCLPSCESLGVRTASSGACHGHYAPADMLLRSRFALCLRGDIPTSPRPYDAMRYGAIPLIVSDHIWRVGLPFQCWVPWSLMAVQVSERVFLKDPSGALRMATSLPARAEARMRQLISHFGRDVLWRHPESRVAENILLAAQRWRRRGKPLLGCCLMEDLIQLELRER